MDSSNMAKTFKHVWVIRKMAGEAVDTNGHITINMQLPDLDVTWPVWDPTLAQNNLYIYILLKWIQ